MLQRQLLQRLTLATKAIIKEKHNLLLTNKGPSFEQFLLQNNLNTNTIKNGNGIKYSVQVYGCQMNVNDTEVFHSIMKSNDYKLVDDHEESKYVFLMTCAIRENAESKIWQKIVLLRNKNKKIGVLGCMAEHLREKLLKEVDLIAGPDAYKSVPLLINALEMNENINGIGNVQLSTEETYADITPVRIHPNSKSAFISITRGCNNMCSFCIVPYTRGIERSRPIVSILDEVQRLRDSGIKEITLLGQNVNSYRDTSSREVFSHTMSPGFNSIYSVKEQGRRFVDLLEKASFVAPKVRFRFVSPHPKDFPMELLQLIKTRDNICKQIHLPLQSGNTDVLKRMRRGYSKEAYLDLALKIRTMIPSASISTDIIVGFCGENDFDFEDTLEVVKTIKFEVAYMYAYSMRPKTHAFHNFEDDVPELEKKFRLQKLIELFHQNSKISLSRFINTTQHVLVEGKGKRENQFKGKSDLGISTHFTSDSPLDQGTVVPVRIVGNSSVSFESVMI